jgi:hypothetical protein
MSSLPTLHLENRNNKPFLKGYRDGSPQNSHFSPKRAITRAAVHKWEIAPAEELAGVYFIPTHS